MAGLWGLKILLFWAGIIGLAYSQGTNTITAPPITSKETSPTSNTSSIQPTSQANSSPTQTSPPVTPPSTTVTATTKASEPPQCSYTVTYNNKLGLQIEINPPGNYTLTVIEEGRPQTGKKIQTDHLKQIPVGKTGHLKPCTNYSLSVSFINDTEKEIFCHSTENKFRTGPMSKGDVKETSCIPGYVCYGSDWDISSSISTPNNLSVVQCTNDKKTFCVRPANEDICSGLTVTFTSGSCVNSSFSFTKNISVDFLNSSEIQQIISTGLPAEINTTLPDLPKCKNLSVSYTCSEKHKPDVVKLSELEPFTDYNCTGLILQNNTSINKTTPSVHVRVDCDLTITNTKKISSNTSIELSWTTTSKNCQQELPNLHKLSYDCICDGQTGKVTSPDGGTCVVTGLIPYTDYKCGVRAKYNKIPVSTGPEVKLQTKIGTPAAVTELKLHVHDHNTIKVSWHRSSTFNGPEGKYIIRLITADDKEVTKKETLNPKCTKCEVEFKDLSYSTTIRQKDSAHNNHPDQEKESNLSLSKPPKMKTFSVAVAVAVVLTFICVQQSSAVPVTEELEEPMSMDYPAAAHEEASVDSWKMLYNSRHKRGIKCRFCCGCCTPGICGVCCRF